MTPISDLQRRTFFRALRTTVVAIGESAEDYRKRIIREELGFEHMSQVNSTDDFEKLMTRMAVDRGDYEGALRFSGGTVRRLHHLIGEAAVRIVKATPAFRGSGWAYVAGVMAQAGMIPEARRCWADRLSSESGWMDFTERDMMKVLMMLQKQVRRMKAA